MQRDRAYFMGDFFEFESGDYNLVILSKLERAASLDAIFALKKKL